MIELKHAVGGIIINQFYLNLYDKMTSTDYNLLVSCKSQLTGYEKSFRVSTLYTNKERYVQGLIYVRAKSQGGENLSTGNVIFGDTNFPYGFYDITIYQNNNDTNLDPANAVKTLYVGLGNCYDNNSDIPVEYTKYTTNDSDTESVYITI